MMYRAILTLESGRVVESKDLSEFDLNEFMVLVLMPSGRGDLVVVKAEVVTLPDRKPHMTYTRDSGKWVQASA
jgi:hypothetical protein